MLKNINLNQVTSPMFKIRQANHSQQNIKTKVNKIKAILAKSLSSVQKDKIFNLSNQESLVRKGKDPNTEPESIGEVLDKLKEGYLMIKHSRNTKEPHKKIVYLSEDSHHLCWKSINKEDEKKLPLSSILNILQKRTKSTLRNQVTINEQARTLLIVSSERNLELEAASEYEADTLKEELSRAIKQAERMDHNYPYSCK